MDKNSRTDLCCGVPAKFHATCCGWINASWVENPISMEDKAAMWDRQQAILALPDSPMKTAKLATLPTLTVTLKI